VRDWSVAAPSLRYVKKIINVPTTMMPEEAKIRFTRLLVIIGSSFLLGGRFRMAGSGDSTPNDCATGPSHIISKLKVYTYPQYLHCVQGVVKPDKSGYRN
jgi:hypothetical protein